ncbi:outer membrane beta-barrel protein [Pedobacter gandavensis]|uniref:Outer membrane beta-barrel protein n=1 Tax=Pedobacter gandavensis TaxID=2679963 RepID=A0ABR6F101_9SPHI|nr:outer membrane beta-barrel protein [Pedobacter gandavensis]MBB2150704.1 outer membrane beta-barrel protein [Pedobacter gandavensis]
MNKKIIMMAALCAVSIAASAQLEKGRLMVGGNVGYSRNSNEGPSNAAISTNTFKSNAFAISPTAGYFINDNLAIGTNISYTNRKSNSTSYFRKESLYGVNPFIRYYLNISSDFKFFAEFMMGASLGKSDEVSNGFIYKNKRKEYSAALAPGLAFLPAKKWSVDLRFNLINYTNSQVKSTNPDAENNRYVGSNYFNFGLNTISPSIGVNYHL